MAGRAHLLGDGGFQPSALDAELLVQRAGQQDAAHAGEAHHALRGHGHRRAIGGAQA
jgi:hypothetical protein